MNETTVGKLVPTTVVDELDGAVEGAEVEDVDDGADVVVELNKEVVAVDGVVVNGLVKLKLFVGALIVGAFVVVDAAVVAVDAAVVKDVVEGEDWTKPDNPVKLIVGLISEVVVLVADGVPSEGILPVEVNGFVAKVDKEGEALKLVPIPLKPVPNPLVVVEELLNAPPRVLPPRVGVVVVKLGTVEDEVGLGKLNNDPDDDDDGWRLFPNDNVCLVGSVVVAVVVDVPPKFRLGNVDDVDRLVWELNPKVVVPLPPRPVEVDEDKPGAVVVPVVEVAVGVVLDELKPKAALIVGWVKLGVVDVVDKAFWPTKLLLLLDWPNENPVPVEDVDVKPVKPNPVVDVAGCAAAGCEVEPAENENAFLSPVEDAAELLPNKPVDDVFVLEAVLPNKLLVAVVAGDDEAPPPKENDAVAGWVVAGLVVVVVVVDANPNKFVELGLVPKRFVAGAAAPPAALEPPKLNEPLKLVLAAWVDPELAPNVNGLDAWVFGCDGVEAANENGLLLLVEFEPNILFIFL